MNTIKATTSYNDMIGTAALDFKGGTQMEFVDYVKSKGVDTEIFEPIGLQLYGGENNFLSISILCVDLSKVDSYKQENNNRIPVVTIRIQESYAKFEKFFKEFAINLMLNVKSSEDYDIIKYE